MEIPMNLEVEAYSTVEPVEGHSIEKIMAEIVESNSQAIESWKIEDGKGIINWKKEYVHAMSSSSDLH